MTMMPMPERTPDPYGAGDPPMDWNGASYDPFEAFRALWRGGAPLDQLYPDGPFALRQPVGPYKPNQQGDVAKVQSLLHDAGYVNANETAGPTGIYSPVLLDEPIKRFQQDNNLTVDGVLEPGGETIGALATLLGPHTGRNPFDISDEAPAPSVAQPGGVQVADESALISSRLRDLGLVTGGTLEMRRKLLELDRSRGSQFSPDGPPPYPAEPPFAPGELQPPGYPAKPPFDPNEANKDRTPPKPIVVKGTTFPIGEDAKPQILIFPDLSDAIEQITAVEDRKGNKETKAQLDRIRDRLIALNPGWKHINGGRDANTGKEKEEYYIPNLSKEHLKDGRKGSIYTDLTFEGPNGEIAHVQTVDVDKNGKPTARELDVAERLFKRTNYKHQVILIPKLRQMRN